MADYHNPADVKFMISGHLVKKSFPIQVTDRFKAQKNVEYIAYLLKQKYRNGKSTERKTYNAYVKYIKTLHESMYAFKSPISNQSYFNSNDVWKAVKVRNYQFYKSACLSIDTVGSYTESKSYHMKDLEVNCLFPKGFESLNADLKTGFSVENPSADDYMSGQGWAEGDANKSAEETLAEYYGSEFVTSDVAIALRKKQKANPSMPTGPKPQGVPFMIDRRPRINQWYNTGKAADLVDRDIQRTVDQEDNLELETPLYGNRFGTKEFQNPYRARQPARTNQFILP